MTQHKSILAELDGLRGENLLTKALCLVIRDALQSDQKLWVSELFAVPGAVGTCHFKDATTERHLHSESGDPLGRVDLLLESPAHQVVVEVKLGAAFQDKQIERYASGRGINAVFVLVPGLRVNEVEAEPASLQLAGCTRVEVLPWEKLLNVLKSQREAIAGTPGSGDRMKFAWLMEEIDLYYRRHRTLFDEGAMSELNSAIGAATLNLRSHGEFMRALLDGLRRLPGWGRVAQRLVSAKQYLGFDLSEDPKGEGPCGWVSFVNTQSYPLSNCESARPSGWQMVLCLAEGTQEPAETPDTELGLERVALCPGRFSGIVRHAKKDSAVFLVKRWEVSSSVEAERLWAERLNAVFGAIWRT